MKRTVTIQNGFTIPILLKHLTIISEDADYGTRTDKAHCFYGSVPTSQENGGNVADSKFMKRVKFNNEFLLRLYIAIMKEIVIPCLNFKIRICSRIVEVLEMEE